jgi:acyl-CoA synthetase (AMP-forming)/AMP-acid ligase II
MSGPDALFLPDALETLVDVIEQRGARTPLAAALHDVVLVGATPEARPTTFASLVTRAAAVSAALARAGVKRGDRVVLAIGRPSRFAAAFLGTIRIGAIAVPIPPADGLELPRAIAERMRAVLEDAAPTALLCDAPRSLAIARSVGDGLAAIDVTTIELGLAAGAPRVAPPSLEDVAFLQYTSGSTGRPRGVVVTHGALVDNLRGITHTAAFGPEDRCVSWLPLFHDMGLIGALLLGLYLGNDPHILEPRTFLMRPVVWLEAMSRFHATFTVAPNFAYALAAQRIPKASLASLDLSRVRLLFDGAEPIDRDTVDAFVARFAPCGLRADAMYPVYGMAEATLAATFPTPGSGARFDVIDRAVLAAERRAQPTRAGDGLHVACLGKPMPGHTVAILAEEGDHALPEREIGEISLRGPSISPRYHGERVDRSVLRTGDLGYLADGELYVVDRLKDLVIVGGRNYAPSDIERAASGVEGLVSGGIAAFGSRAPSGAQAGTDALVVVAALHPSSWRSSAAIRAEVALVVHQRIGIRPARVCIVGPGDLPRTSSGKVRRAACKRAFDENRLPEADGLLSRASLKLARLGRRIGAALAPTTHDEEVTP